MTSQISSLTEYLIPVCNMRVLFYSQIRFRNLAVLAGFYVMY